MSEVRLTSLVVVLRTLYVALLPYPISPTAHGIGGVNDLTVYSQVHVDKLRSIPVGSALVREYAMEHSYWAVRQPTPPAMARSGTVVVLRSVSLPLWS